MLTYVQPHQRGSERGDPAQDVGQPSLGKQALASLDQRSMAQLQWAGEIDGVSGPASGENGVVKLGEQRAVRLAGTVCPLAYFGVGLRYREFRVQRRDLTRVQPQRHASCGATRTARDFGCDRRIA